VLAKLAWRAVSGLSPRIAWKAARLYAWKGAKAIRAHRERLARDELYPPFMLIALTNACNLRCHGCWIGKDGTPHALAPEDVDRIIATGKEHHAHYYILLGGEPFLFPQLGEVFERHPDCYFQIITNGMLFTDDNVLRMRKAGNVTPLVSLDGWQGENDRRRGEGVYRAALAGLDRLREAKLLFGIATTVTGRNLDEVTSDEYVRLLMDKGAMYLWYYVFRPMGPNPDPEYCVGKGQLLRLRERLLELRRRHPILIIDTYWTATGEALCPAAVGLGFHIGPQGGIEICPALSFACDTIRDQDGDLFRTINQSAFLRGFSGFVDQRTRGCVILEHPQELRNYLRRHQAHDTSGRGTALAELLALTPRASHHLPGHEIPEDLWLYRLLKKNLFFGMGAYG